MLPVAADGGTDFLAGNGDFLPDLQTRSGLQAFLVISLYTVDYDAADEITVGFNGIYDIRTHVYFVAVLCERGRGEKGNEACRHITEYVC